MGKAYRLHPFDRGVAITFAPVVYTGIVHGLAAPTIKGQLPVLSSITRRNGEGPEDRRRAEGRKKRKGAGKGG